MTQTKTIYSRLVELFVAFKNKHTPIVLVFVTLGAITLPSYLIQLKIGTLFIVIQNLSRGGTVDPLALMILCVETGLVLYTIGVIAGFFMNNNQAISGPESFEGIHPGLTFSSIPLHLVAPEIKRGDEESLMENEQLANIPTLSEFLDDDLPEGVTPATDLFKYYESMYLEEQDAKETGGPKTMAEILEDKDVDVDDLLRQIQSEDI